MFQLSCKEWNGYLLGNSRKNLATIYSSIGHTGCLAFDISLGRTAVAQWIRLELPSPEITLGSVQDWCFIAYLDPKPNSFDFANSGLVLSPNIALDFVSLVVSLLSHGQRLKFNLGLNLQGHVFLLNVIKVWNDWPVIFVGFGSSDASHRLATHTEMQILF